MDRGRAPAAGRPPRRDDRPGGRDAPEEGASARGAPRRRRPGRPRPRPARSPRASRQGRRSRANATSWVEPVWRRSLVTGTTKGFDGTVLALRCPGRRTRRRRPRRLASATPRARSAGAAARGRTGRSSGGGRGRSPSGRGAGRRSPRPRGGSRGPAPRRRRPAARRGCWPGGRSRCARRAARPRRGPRPERVGLAAALLGERVEVGEHPARALQLVGQRRERGVEQVEHLVARDEHRARQRHRLGVGDELDRLGDERRGVGVGVADLLDVVLEERRRWVVVEAHGASPPNFSRSRFSTGAGTNGLTSPP